MVFQHTTRGITDFIHEVKNSMNHPGECACNTGIRLKSDSWWWLRSPYSNNDNKVGFVNDSGDINNNNADNKNVGVSPASSESPKPSSWEAGLSDGKLSFAEHPAFGQRNLIPFRPDHIGTEKHMLSGMRTQIVFAFIGTPSWGIPAAI